MLLTKNLCLYIILLKNKSLCGDKMKNNKMKKRNTKKFRFSRFKVIRNFTILIILGLLFFSLKTEAYNQNCYKIIIVSQGQTLWEIAKTENQYNEYYKNKDIRFIIKDIKRTNNLKESTIYTNQKLKIIEK